MLGVAKEGRWVVVEYVKSRSRYGDFEFNLKKVFPVIFWIVFEEKCTKMSKK